MVKSLDQNRVVASISRRQFLSLAALSTAAWIAGCATDPVTGQSQLMLVSEQQEIDIDKKNAPLQFSTDYGTSQDKGLNAYLDSTGKKLAAVSHRPGMPYSFHAVNATYVNAYAFPGGSIAATRGILLKLDNEAELAALLSHEIGHVNARHTAEQMSKGVLTQAVLAGISIYAGYQAPGYDRLISQLGMLGAGALLASYSRDNEREADALGMAYMVRKGYGTDGFIGLMDMLNTTSKHKINSFELLFATHPMSDERYETAVKTARTQYAYAKSRPLYKERYMDHTAGLRAIRGTIEELQNGEKELAKPDYIRAERHFKLALDRAPNDYAGLCLMAKCQLAQKRDREALTYAEKAAAVYPQEAQARHLAGYAKIKLKRYDAAYEDFSAYDRLLPGNPNTAFFKGLSLEGMGRNGSAASQYHRYLQSVKQGQQAQYAYQRLVQWGYIR
jgi:predicted Zn-dependent protease